MARRTPEGAPRWRHRIRSARLRAALGLGLVLVLGTGRTWAHWSDQVIISGTTLQAGTIDLKVNDADEVTGYATLNLLTMVPGNSTAAVLTVKNSGTAPLKFTATSSGTNADGKGLAAALEVKVTGDSATSGTAPLVTCSGAALPGAGVTLGGSLVSTGRLLAPGTSEKVCVQLKLPLTAATSLQGAATSVTLTFTGTSDLS